MSLPPDPHALDGLGRNHSIETALADLVDNSIDAEASDVLIRFMQRGGRLCGLYVVDNGRGIRADRVDAAMTVGGLAEYGADSLGKFGLGMKAASFSQARSLTVLSRTADTIVGRRWRIGDRKDFRCDVVPEDFAAEELDRRWNIKSSGTGTVIRWDDVTGFPATGDPTRVQGFLTATMTKILNHLGLVMHRLLMEGRVRIGIDVEDTDQAMAGPRFDATPLDPFGYHKSGHLAYPKRLTAFADGYPIHFDCHIWPGRSKVHQFQLAGGVVERQGLYFYRRKRLLHAGGWDGVTVPDPRMQLARVAIDIDDEIVGLFRMNPEKSRVIVGPEFAHLAEAARAEDGTTMTDYLRDAEAAYRKSRERSRNRRRMIPPGRGFEPAVRGTIADEVPLIEGESPIDIRWRRIEGMALFAIDRVARTLWLNDRYRSAVLGGRRGGLNDAPLVKALLYLLVEDVFQGEYLGAKDKDNIALWQEVLTTAARCEVARSDKE
ncbi:ATP-binding protein [Micromonospora sp. HM134]|uniref:ATP-binding protein n=1 Tax=Micromonospora sp. HM134 TaxID=2583243 RepID=UPI001F0DD0BC|nr:ATP-binding protein [Micromonospora sp. HM134]